MKPRKESAARKRIIAALAKPLSHHELGAAVHLHKRSILMHLSEMRADKEIHTHSWRENSPGPPTRLWVYGPGEDAPMPLAKSPEEHRRKFRSDPEVRAREAEQKRNKRRLKKLENKSSTAFLLGV